MRRTPWTALGLFVLCCWALSTSALAEGDVSVLFGQKMLDFDLDPGEPVDRIVEGLEDQTQFGLMFNFTGEDWPVAIAFDILQADETASGSYTYSVYTYNVEFDAEIREIAVGVRKFFGDRIKPYVGGGLAFVDADLSATLRTPGPGPNLATLSESDNGFGYWIDGGVLFLVGERVHLGIDARLSDAEVTLGFDDPSDVDVGGTHISGFVGFRW